jgi:hypothetical protein
MGKAIGGIGKGFLGASTGGFSALTGSNPITRALGLSGEQGEYFNPQTANAGLEQLNAENAALTDKGYQQRLSDLQSGKLDLAGAQKDLKGAQLEDFNTQGVSGSRVAANEVQNNPLYSSLFGGDGLQSQLAAQGKDLSSRGFSLQPQDREAYGQAAGDIARLYGQQEQAGTQALARRGLASGSSGAAGAMFSGLQGSKNEQLARAQTDIAQKRMADTQQRLLANQQMQTQLGQLGGSLQQNQYQRQLSGAQNRQQNVLNAAQIQNSANANANSANLASMQDKRGAKGKTLLEGFGQGLFSSSQQIGAAPGTFVSGMAGAGGSAMGSGMMASDEDCKENVRDGSKDIQGFLDSLQPHTYEYKPEMKASLLGGEGEFTSPMAQELEETPVGASMVEETPDGKAVDYGKGFGALAAGLGNLNNRLKMLEGSR